MNRSGRIAIMAAAAVLGVAAVSTVTYADNIVVIDYSDVEIDVDDYSEDLNVDDSLEGESVKDTSVKDTSAAGDLPEDASSKGDIKEDKANAEDDDLYVAEGTEYNDEEFMSEDFLGDSNSNYIPEIIEAMDAVNAARTSRGLKPLVLDWTLVEAAKIRSSECAFDFGHNRPDGRDCGTVLDECNVEWSEYSELLARAGSAQGAVDSWLASTSGHREALLSPTVTRMGMACYQNSTYYWTMIVAR